ncbi:50S ribosomal protein L11 methyltransferase [Tsuneonella sp. YG55]|uniref:Ribosomal protein L11 methyltransferase n=1 Tax=Tsuneonella litorea TaxID=2976475 RepID=A0A9X2VZZ3_9SPHN|nr:50S ribosomal protein L11 methyltransferase [Tsuneonella litorea]MCT2558217.1 50S ribosomal protein L11 methyltransferase [Tsuneonella litorea]
MSGETWTLSAFGDKPTIQAALLAQEDAIDWPADVTITGFELADDRPNDWRLDAYFNRKPTHADRRLIASLFAGEAPKFSAEKLPDADWLTESQRGLEPIVAGPFFVRTPEHAPLTGAIDFVIPASQAFGTGHHATTEGCLTMLAAMKERGTVVRNLADIGTGTGLLAFAALALWPRALATASDIDPVCTGVVEANASTNGVKLGAGRGALVMAIADGMDDPLLQARGPYDLLIANILAGPLVGLAPEFSTAVAPGGSLLLAGLLETQERDVRRAYRKAGFRLAARLVNGDWSILWLRRRTAR